MGSRIIWWCAPSLVEPSRQAQDVLSPPQTRGQTQTKCIFGVEKVEFEWCVVPFFENSNAMEPMYSKLDGSSDLMPKAVCSRARDHP